MRRRRLPLAVLLVIAGVVGAGVAFLVAGPVLAGRTKELLFVIGGGVVLIAALSSLEVAMIGLMAISYVDGFLKGLVVSAASVFAKDIVLAIGLMRWLWLGLTRQRWEALRLPVILPAFLFTLYCTAQMFNTETASPLVALAGLRSWVVWIPVLLIAYDYMTTRAHIERMLVTIVVLSLVTGIYAIVQYNLGFEHLYALSSSFDFYDRFGWGSGVRAVSTFVGPGALGDAMSLSAIFCIGAVLYMRGKAWLKPLMIGTAAICLVALATSASRAPLLGLVVGGLGLLLLLRQPRFLFAAVVIGILAVVVLNSYAGGAFEARYNPRILGYRTVIGRTTGPMLKGIRSALERPLGVGVATGTGVGRGQVVVGRQAIVVKRTTGGMVENEYGRALRELGFPGFALFLWMLYAAVKMTVFSFMRVRTVESRSLIAACLAVMLSSVARLAVGSALYLVPGGPLFWLAGALAVRTAEIELARRQSVPESARQPVGRRSGIR